MLNLVVRKETARLQKVKNSTITFRGSFLILGFFLPQISQMIYPLYLSLSTFLRSSHFNHMTFANSTILILRYFNLKMFVEDYKL